MNRLLITLFVSLTLALTSLPNHADPAKEAVAQLKQGEKLYQEHCLMCHGADGRGGSGFPRPIWGKGHDLAKFANARGLLEYMQLSMPFDNPQKMNDAEKIAVIAYMLKNNGSWKAEGGILNAGNLPTVAIK
jgi:Cytochrome c